MTAQGYPDGYDVMWAASDRDGRIGVFFSAGPGPIPKAFRAYEDYQQEDLAAYLLALPERGEAVAVGEEDLFGAEKLAKVGCYVFDWSDVHRISGHLHAYELLRMPSAPLSLADLSSDVRELLTTVSLPNITFGNETTLDVEAHCECLHETQRPNFYDAPSVGPAFLELRLARPETAHFSIRTLFRRLLGR